MILIDKLAYSSRLRYRSPGLKALLAVGALVLCVAARSFIVSLSMLCVMGCLTVTFGGTSFGRYVRLMALPLGFLLMSTVAVVFHMSEEPSAIFSLGIGSRYLVTDSSSLVYGLRLLATALSAVSCLYFLSLTTPLADILGVLRFIRCPGLVIELMFLIYRFTFVILELASAILTAQQCRLGNKDFRTAMHGVGQMFAVLLQRALAKSSMLYDAMEARCYNGRIQVLGRTCRATAREKVGVGLFFAVFIGLAVVCRVYGGSI
ncbi:MAG: cbiQ [Paenibacillaceae bacterium]|jgi:cobalt/nickel transport system permease protein|nr:cbiQ [Paenibacillaceae bacterium]